MRLSELYKALADDSRLRLISVLARGLFNVQELTAVLGISQPTVSHHLKVLHGAGLTRVHREGTWSYYGLANHIEGENGTSANSPVTSLTRELSTLLKNNPPHGSEHDEQRIAEILAARRNQAHQFFERVAPEWRTLRHELAEDESCVERVLQSVEPNETVVDLGCGSGALLERLLPRTGSTIGVDYSQAMLAEARRALGDRVAQVDLRIGSLEHLPLADESVDLAVAYMVCHHLPTPSEALADAARVLKPGGRLLIVDLTKHNDEHLRERFADQWLGFDLNQFSEWILDAGLSPPKTELVGIRKSVFFLETYKQGK